MIPAATPMKWCDVQTQVNALKNAPQEAYSPIPAENTLLDSIVTKICEFIARTEILQLLASEGKLKLKFLYWHDQTMRSPKRGVIAEIHSVQKPLSIALAEKIKLAIRPKTISFHFIGDLLCAITSHIANCHTILHVSKKGECVYQKPDDRFNVHASPVTLTQQLLWSAERQFLSRTADENKIQKCLNEIFSRLQYASLIRRIPEEPKCHKIGITLFFNPTDNIHNFPQLYKHGFTIFYFSNYRLDEVIAVIHSINEHGFLPMQPSCYFLKPNKIRIRKSWEGRAHEMPLVVAKYTLYRPNAPKKVA